MTLRVARATSTAPWRPHRNRCLAGAPEALGAVFGALVILVGIAAGATFAGLYNIAADVPHTQPVYWLLETARERSVAVRARDIVVPNDLDDANRIPKGRANMRKCAAAVTLRPEWKGLRS